MDFREGAVVGRSATAPYACRDIAPCAGRFLQTMYRDEPSVYAAYSRESAKAAPDAIARAGRKDRQAIRAAVFARSGYNGILGTWSFDANCDTTLTTTTGRRVVNGAFNEENAVLLEAQ